MVEADARLVSIFKTGDPGVMPLAEMALESAGIEFWVRTAGKADSLAWQMSQVPTNRPLVQEIFVTADMASQARDLVVDLEQQPGESLANVPTVPDLIDPPTIRLEDAQSGIALGTITEAQLQEFTSHLEEEAPQQYFVNAGTVEMLQSRGVEIAVVELLRKAVGAGDGVSVRWTA
jgi:hypothetical protein